MRTELNEIQFWTRKYYNPGSFMEYNKAFTYLKKIHDKYGTIDINIIKSLIN